MDELRTISNIQLEQRSIVVHFDLSGSMSCAGFSPLVKTITDILKNIKKQNNIEVYFSLFGGSTQEDVHRVLGERLLTLDEFCAGNYKPGGGTAFCPSFARTKHFLKHDAIIISDGEFTDSITQLSFQDNCETVFFVAPPWSPSGIEQKHASAIAKCVHSNVAYIGVASGQYKQLETTLEEFSKGLGIVSRLPGFSTIGTYLIPTILLLPTHMKKTLDICLLKGEDTLQILTKKIIGLFRYLEETSKLSFERCIRGDEFRQLMSLLVPIKKLTFAHLETSLASQQLYGYLSKLLDSFGDQYNRLLKSYSNDKNKNELTKLWDDAMNVSERELIFEENNEKYGQPVGYLKTEVTNMDITPDMLAAALHHLKTIYSMMDTDLVNVIFGILINCKIAETSAGPQDTWIPVWSKPSDGTIDLLSIIRLLPTCLRQLQHFLGTTCDSDWTIQPMTAIRFAWIMDVSGHLFPDFVMQSLPTLVRSNANLIDLDQDENRSVFWLKILQSLAVKLSLSTETLLSIKHILIVNSLKGFLLRLTDTVVRYERQIYENVSPYIDTNEPKAWCVFVDQNGNMLNAETGVVVGLTNIVSDPKMVQKWYDTNFYKKGAVVRPRYLTLIDNPNLAHGSIELYNSSAPKDIDILREQLLTLGYSTVQIDAHINTTRDKIKHIPRVIQNQDPSSVVLASQGACQGATIPTETITINISHHTQYPNEIDYAIGCGLKSNSKITPQTPFHHLDKLDVQKTLLQYQEQFEKTIKSIEKPIVFTPLTIQKAAAQTATTTAITTSSIQSIPTSQSTPMSEELFTCPITQDIMENPSSTAPCGHMFEYDAINVYLKTVINECPMCRTQITSVTPNYAFKSVIQSWRANQQPKS
ncbi:unnamed protein product [Didymodactylos carnosus]|uniref:U-box domain-containing protein n=1 Tax=Didymodactylos carnosus TaxID=1234261 RepID=A0A8S2FG27_9BILA|nr:unnamed protein product [Didymodactylos carnosus]CAF4251660.1 unnamed protein product [Didymodactylos carnosus]